MSKSKKEERRIITVIKTRGEPDEVTVEHHGESLEPKTPKVTKPRRKLPKPKKPEVVRLRGELLGPEIPAADKYRGKLLGPGVRKLSKKV